ncbi:MAG: hypothetical protein AAF597_17150, partial [Bacteroidota bacterium]
MSLLPKPYTFDAFRDPATGVVQVVPSMDTLSSRTPLNTKDEPTNPIVPSELNQGWQWAPWGIDDRLPTTIREKVEEVPIAGQAIYRLMGMMYGNGLAYYRNSDLEGGNTKVSRAYIPEIE